VKEKGDIASGPGRGIYAVRTDEGLEVRYNSAPPMWVICSHGAVLAGTLRLFISQELRRTETGPQFQTLLEFTIFAALTFAINCVLRLTIRPDTITVDPGDPARYRSARCGWRQTKDERTNP
jgi:hypothetical protein